MSDTNFETLWGAIPYPAFALDEYNQFLTCNPAAEFLAALRSVKWRVRNYPHLSARAVLCKT